MYQKLCVWAYVKLGWCKPPSVTSFWERTYRRYTNGLLENRAVSWACPGSVVWGCTAKGSPCDRDWDGGRSGPWERRSGRYSEKKRHHSRMPRSEVKVGRNTSENGNVRKAFFHQNSVPFHKKQHIGKRLDVKTGSRLWERQELSRGLQRLCNTTLKSKLEVFILLFSFSAPLDDWLQRNKLTFPLILDCPVLTVILGLIINFWHPRLQGVMSSDKNTNFFSKILSFSSRRSPEVLEIHLLSAAKCQVFRWKIRAWTPFS